MYFQEKRKKGMYDFLVQLCFTSRKKINVHIKKALAAQGLGLGVGGIRKGEKEEGRKG